MNKTQHGTFPFAFDSWNEMGVEQLLFENVEVLKDFGTIKKGTYGSAYVDGQEGIFEVYNDEGTEIIATQRYKAVPVID